MQILLRSIKNFLFWPHMPFKVHLFLILTAPLHKWVCSNILRVISTLNMLDLPESSTVLYSVHCTRLYMSLGSNVHNQVVLAT